MEFKLLRTFESVASLLSFSRAARVLHCTQSTVSAQIRALEDDLGAPVFERLGTRVTLTAAGAELLHHTRRMLGFEREVRAAIARTGELFGHLTLRVPQSVADTHLPELLARFAASHPRVGIDISNCGYFHLADELRSGAVDAAFLLGRSVEAPDLRTSALLDEPMVWATHPASPLVARSGLGVADLAGQTLIVPKHDCGYRMDLEQDLLEAGVEVAAILELNSLTALVRCLLAGVGVALVPRRTVAAELADGRLAELAWAAAPKSTLYLMRHRDKPLTGAFGAFVALVEERFAALRSEAPSGRSGIDRCRGHSREPGRERRGDQPLAAGTTPAGSSAARSESPAPDAPGNVPTTSRAAVTVAGGARKRGHRRASVE